MKIEHVAMYVNDLEAARDFFVKYLGGTSNGGYHNEKTDVICGCCCNGNSQRACSGTELENR